MSHKNALRIEDLDRALCAIQKAIDDLNDANEQLENSRTILFSRFGMSESDRGFENRIKFTQETILRHKMICDVYKDFISKSKEAMIDYEQNKEKYDKLGEKWK